MNEGGHIFPAAVTGKKDYAIYAITKHGLEVAARVKAHYSTADLFVPAKFMNQAPAGSLPLPLPMGPALQENFQAYHCHVFVISVGAVVRMIAPLLINKKVDPAVICIDDLAQFTICVLSGHVGRGNFFTQGLAQLLGNIPVITTASDVSGTLTVDILGRDLGWVLEDMDRNVTRSCAAVVNEAPVAFVQECGEGHWWPLDRPMPPGVRYFLSLDEFRAKDFEAILIASDRDDVDGTHPEHFARAVVYRPPTLILGLGCDRNIPFQVLEEGVFKLLKEKNLSAKSVKGIASVDLKREEPALLELAEKYGWPFTTFSAEELEQAKGVENASARVRKFVGTSSVSEAAALLASGASSLLMPKTIFRREEGGKNMTMAIARMNHYPRRNR